jgi:hypothetical protein
MRSVPISPGLPDSRRNFVHNDPQGLFQGRIDQRASVQSALLVNAPQKLLHVAAGPKSDGCMFHFTPHGTK